MLVYEDVTYNFFSCPVWTTRKVHKIDINKRLHSTTGSYEKPRKTGSTDSNYCSVGSQTSSECASDLQSGIGINQDWADESSTVFNMNHVKGPPAYLAMETRSDYAR